MSFWEHFKDKNGPTKADQVQEIPLAQVIVNRYQPRQKFDNEKILELAQSIATNGLLQPIIVRLTADQKYELIAGERRFRAISQLQWSKIPAIVRDYDDQQSASLALIENLQRQDLNPIEEAQAYQNLMQMNHLTQKDLAKHLGKSQSYIANKIRLLNLTPTVQTALAQGQISQRHGRALLQVPVAHQSQLLAQIQAKHLTVQQTERLIQKEQQPATTKQHKKIRALTSKSPQLAINTVRDSVKLARKNGAQFAYQETETDQEYQMIITIKKENKHG